MKNNYFLLFLSIFFLTACNSTKNTNSSSAQLSQEEMILQKVVEAHGGAKYQTAHFSFTFRKKNYTFKNNKDQFRYSVTSKKDGKEIIDILENGILKRKVNGVETELSEKQISAYSGSLNSVIYFATLPYKLQDKAVKKSYQGTTTIKGKTYEILEIRFEQEGGGRDHDDVFHYWINQENHVIDYLAYNYQVNGGGVRFRSAYNSRNIRGIIFQDYVNYKAKVGTPLADLPKLFEQGKLKELSRIETENVLNVRR
ncbi:MAG: DUF6503 family protein [Saprospiraceae bacterium]